MQYLATQDRLKIPGDDLKVADNLVVNVRSFWYKALRGLTRPYKPPLGLALVAAAIQLASIVHALSASSSITWAPQRPATAALGQWLFEPAHDWRKLFQIKFRH